VLYRVLRYLLAALVRLLFRLEVRGREWIPASGGVMIVANHASLLDPPIVGVAAWPRALHFLAKAELFRIPLFGRLIRALNARPVRRGGADPAALREGLRILAGGGALLVFPEGTRSRDGTLGEGKAGAGLLALHSGAPVVPAYIEGAGRALPRGRVVPVPTRVRVTFGPPLRLGRAGGPARRARCQEASREMMAAIARLRDAGGPVGGAGRGAVGWGQSARTGTPGPRQP
jgi:1-acyl-sn-glycerol-3-phosphate acyltransferase